MSNRKYFSIFILAFIFLSESLLAYTDISGNISGQTLNADTTYHVIGDLQIDDNTTTIIDSGAVLKFDPGVQIIVYGTLSTVRIQRG